MTDETMQTAEPARTQAVEPGPTPGPSPVTNFPVIPSEAARSAAQSRDLIISADPHEKVPPLRAARSGRDDGDFASHATALGSTPEQATYADFKLPEGAVVDAAALDQARLLFAEAGLPQDQAQKFIDLAVSREQAAAAKGVQAFVDLQNKWVSEIKADPEIGGTRLEASMAQAARAIDRLGVPGLKEALNLTGAGNNPAIVKAFVRLGQMVSEDRFAPGRDAAPPASRSPAETIYDGNPRQSR